MIPFFRHRAPARLWVWLLLVPLFASGTLRAADIGVRDRLGGTVPLDLTFKDEAGQTVRLGDLIQRPTFLAPVYFSCPGVCPTLLTSLAEVLSRLPAEPGRDYQVLAVSFDETDIPDSAAVQKRKYLGFITRPFPEGAWHFLTGDSTAIRGLTRAIGYGFQRQGKDFLHPVTLVVISPRGKIARYLYGTDFLPFDLKMALVEAEHERTGPAISRVLRFCFSYEPKSRRLVFNTLRVTGTVTLAFALAFIAFLVFGVRKRSSQSHPRP